MSMGVVSGSAKELHVPGDPSRFDIPFDRPELGVRNARNFFDPGISCSCIEGTWPDTQIPRGPTFGFWIITR
jgi:hypothetical protein